MSGFFVGWVGERIEFKGIGCKCICDNCTYPMPLVIDCVLTGLAFCRLSSSC
ncbi:MAG: hypothetical protein IKP73_20410 [Bacteroidales bacterium]|nr:hypothetical protein [Bacteroidales bacterium]